MFQNNVLAAQVQRQRDVGIGIRDEQALPKTITNTLLYNQALGIGAPAKLSRRYVLSMFDVQAPRWTQVAPKWTQVAPMSFDRPKMTQYSPKITPT